MRVAVCSDEPYDIHGVVLEELRRRGHEPVVFGSLRSGAEEPCGLGHPRGALEAGEIR